MILSDIRGKNILIMTYAFESGLFYLGKSLIHELDGSNNVFLFPKERWKKIGSSYRPHYPPAEDAQLLDGIDAIPIRSYNDPHLLTVVSDLNIDIIFSIETFMKKSQWIRLVRNSRDIRIYDIPMPEWTNPATVRSGHYRVFNKILCLTKPARDLFSGYPNKDDLSWDYANYLTPIRSEKEPGLFYHQASLNPGFSQKNTANVIKAFSSFSSDKNISKLIITGKLSLSEKILADKCKKITHVERTLGKGEICEIYDKSQFLLAPSTREGLGLSFYEAKKMGCKIISSDIEPINHMGDYLCKVISYNNDGQSIPHAIIGVNEIKEQLHRCYEDIGND
jgi:hypothetical protein